MTHTSLTRWVKAADARQVCGAALRASRQIVQRAGGIRCDRLAVDLPSDGRTGFSNSILDQRLAGHVASITNVSLTKLIGGMLLVISGVLAFDLVVLWIAAGKVLERLPF